MRLCPESRRRLLPVAVVPKRQQVHLAFSFRIPVWFCHQLHEQPARKNRNNADHKYNDVSSIIYVVALIMLKLA